MSGILSDDIGSFPLGQGSDIERIQRIAYRIAVGVASDGDRAEFCCVLGDAMERKIGSGIRRPNYPQVTDMVGFYRMVLENFPEEGEPWLVQKRHAVIPELFSLEGPAKRFLKEKGVALEARVCVTGPFELYQRCVGAAYRKTFL